MNLARINSYLQTVVRGHPADLRGVRNSFRQKLVAKLHDWAQRTGI